MGQRYRWTIGFDADDTLWHNERFFQLTQARFAELLADFTDPDALSETLMAAERRNLGRYGFGVKGFVLSMIETAIDVTDAKVPATVIAELIRAGQDMLEHPIELLPHAAEAIGALAPEAEIVLITKGDLLDQERKLAQSGLGDLFDAVEIVSDKTPDVYARIFARHGATAAMMVGNSMRSDVLPAIEAGGWGVHVPHDLTWAYEHAEAPSTHPRFREIESLAALPELVAALP
ncbi:HAD family hydrolase [Flavimaricola marinus]|uniref:DUMP phosphatase n=1 Tax=Flavimaricola marinus TaxID=1819565 RepID=A0A238LCT6_9RHOB|nr:HAD family hydrolase [Flavimaricola marinus]SMY06730.1 dUMP phosphatase [Flavimaricola marinus]